MCTPVDCWLWCGQRNRGKWMRPFFPSVCLFLSFFHCLCLSFTLSFFLSFFSCFVFSLFLGQMGRKGGGPLPAAQLHQHPGDAGRPLDVNPGSLMWSIFQGYCSWFRHFQHIVDFIAPRLRKSFQGPLAEIVHLRDSICLDTCCQSLARRVVQFVLPSVVPAFLCRPQRTSCHVLHEHLALPFTAQTLATKETHSLLNPVIFTVFEVLSPVIQLGWFLGGFLSSWPQDHRRVRWSVFFSYRTTRDKLVRDIHLFRSYKLI